MKEIISNIWAKKVIRKLIISLFSLIVFFLILQIIPPKKIKSNPFVAKPNEVLVAAHRGGKNLNPENTFKAFDYAINDLKIDILELDLVMTKDNQLVSIHNDTLNETCDIEEILGENKKYYVRDFTLEELQYYNFGYKFKDKDGNYLYRDLVSFDDINRKKIIKANNLNIVTIDEIFKQYYKLDILFIVEIKDSGEVGKLAADKLNELLLEYSLYNKVTIGTFNDDISNYLREKYPRIILGGSVGDVTKFIVTQMLGVNIFNRTRFANLQIPTSQKAGGITIRLDKSTYINRAHRRGISVQYWTINDKEEMRKLIKLGADVIMTDNPDVLIELLKEMGYRNK